MDAFIIREACGLSMALISSFNLLLSYLYGTSLIYSIPFMTTYFITDLFYTKKNDMRLHHTFCLLLITYFLCSGVYFDDALELARAIYITEFSSIFLGLMHFLKPGSMLELLNKLLFVSSFAYARIYVFYNTIADSNSYTGLMKYDTRMNYILYTGCYGLMTLNIYWFSIILKKLVKGPFKYLQCPQLIRTTLSYMYIANPIIMCYILKTSPMPYCIFLGGLINLSFHSYVWHSKCGEYIKDKPLNIVSDELVWYFLKDNAAIQLVGFSASVAAYYESEWFYRYLLASILYHIIPISVQYYMTILMKKEGNVIDEKSSGFLITSYILLSASIATDVFLCGYHSVLYSTGVPLFFLHVIIGCVLKMNTFYQFSHIFFHSLLWFQIALLSYSNSRPTY